MGAPPQTTCPRGHNFSAPRGLDQNSRYDTTRTSIAPGTINHSLTVGGGVYRSSGSNQETLFFLTNIAQGFFENGGVC